MSFNRRTFLHALASLGVAALDTPTPGKDQLPNPRHHPLLYKRKLPAEGETVTLMIVGDCSFARGTAQGIAAHQNNFDYPLDQVRDWLRSADYTAGNQEGVIAAAGQVTARLGSLRLRADPDAAAAYQRAGFDLLSLANNHTLDFGPPGLKQTIDTLNAAGVRTMGAGADGQAARAPVIITLKGIRIGWLAVTQVGDPPDEDAIAEARDYGRAWLDESTIEAEVAAARALCDVLIVMPHWGHEYQLVPHETQVRIAVKMVLAGASLVVGHHPHVAQASVVYQDRLICYSLGNFLFDQFDKTGFALWVRLDRRGIIEGWRIGMIPGVHPVWVKGD